METLRYKKPSPTCRMFASRMSANAVQVLLYEPNDLAPSPEWALVGAGIVAALIDPATDELRWEATGMAAVRGYGLFLYEICAKLVKHPLHATDDQSDDAKRFWAKQGQRFIEPLTDADFTKKYDFNTAERTSHTLSPRQIERMRSHAVDVFCGARMNCPSRLMRDSISGPVKKENAPSVLGSTML